jgi:hypothetical protein
MYGDYTPYSLPTWALGLPHVLPHKPWKSERISDIILLNACLITCHKLVS